MLALLLCLAFVLTHGAVITQTLDLVGIPPSTVSPRGLLLGEQMITIQRERTPDLIPQILPHLVLADDLEREAFGQKLAHYIVTSPECVLFLSAMDEGGKVVGFVIAENPPSTKYITINQAWIAPGQSFKLSNELFLRVTMWAIGLDKTTIRAETKRNTGPLFRRFGFEPVSVNVEYRVPQSLMPEILSVIRGETDG